jgi:ABC-type phosphate transport system substrate-binding protein
VKKLSSILGLALGTALAGSSTAHAQAATPDCTSLNGGDIVVVSGSSAMGALMTHIGPILANAANPMQIVYAGPGSCAGVQQVAQGLAVKGTASYWPAGSTEGAAASTCNLPTDGLPVDLGLSDVFAASCPDAVVSATDKAKVDEKSILVLPFAFIVPSPGSTQTSIDAREAYYIYGKGETAKVAPWNATEVQPFLTDKSSPNLYQYGPVYQRDQTSGTQITIFKNIHLKVDTALAQNAFGTGTMVKAVAQNAMANATLGFASTDGVDNNRDTVKTLAYRHWNQKLFYWPDSTGASGVTDKANVLDGHYPLWSYEHALLPKTGASDNGKKLRDYLTGATDLPSSSLANVITDSRLVPLCAMKVQRTKDAGDLSAYTDAKPCGCDFYKRTMKTNSCPQGSN